jgi:hypothetical protein
VYGGGCRMWKWWRAEVQLAVLCWDASVKCCALHEHSRRWCQGRVKLPLVLSTLVVHKARHNRGRGCARRSRWLATD